MDSMYAMKSGCHGRPRPPYFFPELLAATITIRVAAPCAGNRVRLSARQCSRIRRPLASSGRAGLAPSGRSLASLQSFASSARSAAPDPGSWIVPVVASPCAHSWSLSRIARLASVELDHGVYISRQSNEGVFFWLGGSHPSARPALWPSVQKPVTAVTRQCLCGLSPLLH